MPCPTSKKTSTAKNETKIENLVFFLDIRLKILYYVKAVKVSLCIADMAQSVERILGKDEVTGSIPVISSKTPAFACGCFFCSDRRPPRLRVLSAYFSRPAPRFAFRLFLSSSVFKSSRHFRRTSATIFI